MENQILVNKTSKKILLYKVYEIHKKPPIGWFFELLELEYYISLITSYLRSKLQKNATSIVFCSEAVLSLITALFKRAKEPTKSSVKRTVL